MNSDRRFVNELHFFSCLQDMSLCPLFDEHVAAPMVNSDAQACSQPSDNGGWVFSSDIGPFSNIYHVPIKGLTYVSLHFVCYHDAAA